MRCKLDLVTDEIELGDVIIDGRGVKVMAIRDGMFYRFLDLRDTCVLQDKANSWIELLDKYFSCSEVSVIKSEDLILTNTIGGN